MLELKSQAERQGYNGDFTGHLKPLLDFYAWSPSFFFAALFLPKTLHSLAR
jgi:hypothetical protein